jgi:hypothetical protein
MSDESLPAFLYTSSFIGVSLHPVTVLSAGLKRTRVRLRYAASFAGKRHASGALITVPSHAVGGPLRNGWLSVGRGKFERPSARHRKAFMHRYLVRLGPDFIERFLP